MHELAALVVVWKKNHNLKPTKMSSFISGKNDSAVETLLSQAKDLYVLEQVAKINCSGFTDDSTALSTDLETRFCRLKSLPVSRPEQVTSSSRKLLSHSKSMVDYSDWKNRGNMSSVSAFSNQDGKSCPLDSSVEETRGGFGESSDSRRISSSSSRFSRGNMSSVSTLSNFSGEPCPLESSVEETQMFSGIKHNPSVNSRGGLGESSDSRRLGSSSTRYSREGKILTPPTTQTLKLLPREKSTRISSSSFTSSDLASSSSDQDQKERSNQKSKSKSKFLTSWFDKLSLGQAMGCLRLTPDKSSTNSKKTNKKEVYGEEELKKAKASFKETERLIRKARKTVKRSRRLRSESTLDQLLGKLF